MGRFSIQQPLDDPSVSDGDVGFKGFNATLPPWQLDPGMLEVSENGRIDGAWVPRKGVQVLTVGSLALGAPLRLPFWLVDAVGGEIVTAATRVGPRVSLNCPGLILPSTATPSKTKVMGMESGTAKSLSIANAIVGENSELFSVACYQAKRYIAQKIELSFSNKELKIRYLTNEQYGFSGTLRNSQNFVITFTPFRFNPTTKSSRLGIGESLITPVPTQWIELSSGGNFWELTDVTGGITAVWRLPNNMTTVTGQLYPAGTFAHSQTVGTWVPFLNCTGVPVSNKMIDATSSLKQIADALSSDPAFKNRFYPLVSLPDDSQIIPQSISWAQGGSGTVGVLGFEAAVTAPTVNPVSKAFMSKQGTPIAYDIPNAVGNETYTITNGRLLSRIDDTASEFVLGSCLFSDPSSANDESIFMAFGKSVTRIDLATYLVTTISLPASRTLYTSVEMVQALDRVFIFVLGELALEWKVGMTAFTEVPSGTYVQPQIFEVTGANCSVTNGVCTLGGLTNTTIKTGDVFYITATTEARLTPLVGQKLLASFANATSVQFMASLANLATIGANTVTVAKLVSVGGGYIYQPGVEWAVYFQKRIWAPFTHRWNGSSFTDRKIKDEIIASDILDPHTFDPISSQFRITGGVADHIVALHPFVQDTLLVFNRNSIHSIGQTVGRLSDTVVRELTREIGCLARQSIVSHGSSIFFLSDNGVYGLSFVDQYNLRGVEKPLSASILPIVARISKSLASGAVATYFDNRYWLAVPLDSTPGQGDAQGNNAILIYNTLNEEWESVDSFADPLFVITKFIIGAAGSRNDIYAVTRYGGIHALDKLDEGVDSIASSAVIGAVLLPIKWKFKTRGYNCGTTERKRFGSFGLNLKSGSSPSNAVLQFTTEDPDSNGITVLAAKNTIAGQIESGNTADIRHRVGGLRGVSGAITVTTQKGRPIIRSASVQGTIANRSIITQK